MMHFYGFSMFLQRLRFLFLFPFPFRSSRFYACCVCCCCLPVMAECCVNAYFCVFALFNNVAQQSSAALSSATAHRAYRHRIEHCSLRLYSVGGNVVLFDQCFDCIGSGYAEFIWQCALCVAIYNKKRTSGVEFFDGFH